MPSSDILHLPISHHGFGFISVSCFNDASAVSGVLRDLNHHIPLFHCMARITLADWQCSLTKCIFPFSHNGLCISYRLSRPSIPIHFTLAHQVLCSLKLNILPTEQSACVSGEISIIHVAHQLPNSPHITSLRCYINTPYHFLRAWGSWHQWGLSPSNSHFNLSDNPNPFPLSLPQHYNFRTVQQWLVGIDLSPLACGPSVLLMTTESRRQSAEFVIQAFTRSQARANSDVQSSRILPPDLGGNHCIWATDGSCIEGSQSGLQSVTSAIVGPVDVASRIMGMNATSTHGEVLALIMAASLASSILDTHFPSSSFSPSSSPLVLSDHLHSIRLIQDFRSSALPPNFWAFRPTRSYY